MLSQAIDLRTSVRLAKTQICDVRLLRKPPKLPNTVVTKFQSDPLIPNLLTKNLLHLRKSDHQL